MDFNDKKYNWDLGSSRESIKRNTDSLVRMIVDLRKEVADLRETQKTPRSARDIYYCTNGFDRPDINEVISAVLSYFNLRIVSRSGVAVEKRVKKCAR